MNKPVYSFREHTMSFLLLRRGDPIAKFDSISSTEFFMRWLVDLLNKNHEEFTKDRSEKLIKELGF